MKAANSEFWDVWVYPGIKIQRHSLIQIYLYSNHHCHQIHVQHSCHCHKPKNQSNGRRCRNHRPPPSKDSLPCNTHCLRRCISFASPHLQVEVSTATVGVASKSLKWNHLLTTQLQSALYLHDLHPLSVSCPWWRNWQHFALVGCKWKWKQSSTEEVGKKLHMATMSCKRNLSNAKNSQTLSGESLFHEMQVSVVNIPPQTTNVFLFITDIVCSNLPTNWAKR